MLLPFFFTITNCSSENICHFAHIWVYLGKIIEVELLSPRRLIWIDIAKLFCRGACPRKICTVQCIQELQKEPFTRLSPMVLSDFLISVNFIEEKLNLFVLVCIFLMKNVRYLNYLNFLPCKLFISFAYFPKGFCFPYQFVGC